jgi:hypothetical protein
MNGAAIPIRDQKGAWVSFLSMHGLKLRKDMKQVRAEIPLMLEAAGKLEKLYFGSENNSGEDLDGSDDLTNLASPKAANRMQG